MTTAADWFESATDFRQLCGDAQSQARSESDQEFAATMMLRANQYGLDSYLTIGQLKSLCRIADWDEPQRRQIPETAAAVRAEKVRHVVAAKQSRNHRCHWPDCNKQVPPAMWGCKSHWFAIPKHLRDRIWKSYRPGQEEDLRPSEEYLEAARAVQLWIAEQKLAGKR